MNALGVLAAAGLVTWALRIGLIKVVPARNLPIALRGALEATAPAAMASLIVNDLVHTSSEGVPSLTAAILATVVAAGVAWRFRSVALVVVAGMTTYWAASLVL